MNRLVELLISLLGDRFSWTELLASLAEKLLGDVYTPGGCKEYVINHLKAGTLDDEFAKNPVTVLICLGHVALALAEKIDGHDHDTQGFTDEAWVIELSTACGEEIPCAGGGALAAVLIEVVVRLIAKYLNK